MTMKYLTFSYPEENTYPVCFLVSSLNHNAINQNYLKPFFEEGDLKEIVAYSLLKGPKKTKVAVQRSYLDELIPVLRDLDVSYIVACDAEYFRTLTGGKGGEPHLGYVLPSCETYAGFNVIYCPNVSSFFYNPDKANKAATMAFKALKDHRAGCYTPPGQNIITFEEYPWHVKDIKRWLNHIVDMPLTADIEGFSLKFYDSGIGTISFAWSKNEGIAFPVDFHPANVEIRALLKDFFIRRAEKNIKTIWHAISFDVTVLIYQLFMNGFLDTRGLLQGLDVMLKSWDCTKLITYLATNTCAGNDLGLKFQSQEFSGNYAVENITDITLIPLADLLRYNLVDTLSTWYVYEKHYPKMIEDQQLDIYENLFKPGTIDIIQMQLTGLPINMDEVKNLEAELHRVIEQSLSVIKGTSLISNFVHKINVEWVEMKNRTLKRETRTLQDAKEQFNPNSDPQLRRILYDEDFMGLPVFDYTDTKLPATGAATLQKQIAHSTNEDHIEFLEALIEYKKAEKIRSSFLQAFLNAPMAEDGWHYLFGNFNLGGTVSGRLSSNGPNLQNIPSKHDEDELFIQWAKPVKRCIQAPPGKLFVGLDFDSLEDVISAVTTKDPNKLNVYIHGYDGHSFRAYSYFSERMPDIDPDSVQSINSIKKRYPAIRQESKTPTFLLTYQGTYIGIIEKLAWTKEKAQQVEARYHDLYRVSDEWVAARIEEASRTGYLTAAFGLRLRTPLLHQVILGNQRTPYEAKAEARTAGNALGQSWCLLNTRAGVEFNSKVRSGKYRLNIRPSAHIHDAQYFIIDDDIETLQYLNKHLVKAVSWQDHPEIWHDQVKISGEVSVFYPSWAEEMPIPHDASSDKIRDIALDHFTNYCQTSS